MKQIFTFIFLFICTNIFATSYKVLFIGNSYTYVNDLPNTLAQLATSMGDTVIVNSATAGGATLNAQFNNPNVYALIQQGNWDFIVIQAQSQEPSFPPSQVATDVLPYAKSLDSMAKALNPCAEVFYFMTWGRKNGDAANCGFYPPICTYTGMQQRLRESYLLMAQNNNSNVCPVGIAWQRVRNIDSNIVLYNADESHPSVQGTYVAACSFYSSFFHKKTDATSFVSAGILVNEAVTIQNASNFIVLDSIENWQQYGTMPFAKFIGTNGNPYSFNNLSKRHLSSSWSFGDGNFSTSNTAIVTNNYKDSTASYWATLTVSNACGKQDQFSTSIDIVGSTGIYNLNNKDFEINCANNFISINNRTEANVIIIYNINGTKIMEQKLVKGGQQIELKNNVGIIYYKIIFKNKNEITGKLQVQ
jgi:hypothetical protein